MNKVLRRSCLNRLLLKQVYNRSSAAENVRQLRPISDRSIPCSAKSSSSRRRLRSSSRPHLKVGLSTKVSAGTSCCYSSCSTNSQDTMSQHIVGHDKTKNYFYIKLKDSSPTKQEAMALLEYKWVRKGVVDMYHTEVPPEFQGHGIAKILAKTAFDYFCEQDVVMRPTCTYLQKFLRDNPTPRYMDHVDKEYA